MSSNKFEPLAYLEILRPMNGAMAAAAALVGALIAAQGLPQEALLAALITFIALGAGNAVNDYYDYEIDKINSPSRPLPAGRMSLGAAHIYSAILFTSAIVLSSLINSLTLAIAVFNCSLLYAYAWKIKKTGGLLKNAAVSYLVASPFLFGGAAVSNVGVTIFLAVLAALGNTGREIVKDIEDYEGDRRFARTLPATLGFDAAARLASLFVLLAILLSPLPYFLGMLSEYYLALVIPADLYFAHAMAAFVKNVSVESARSTQRAIKRGMGLALLAFLAGGI